MLFTLVLRDDLEHTALRQELRPQHLAYLDAIEGQIAFAGPLTSDDGRSPLGSLLVIDFPSRVEAQTWLESEPYCRAGLFCDSLVIAFINRFAQRAGFPESL